MSCGPAGAIALLIETLNGEMQIQVTCMLEGEVHLRRMQLISRIVKKINRRRIAKAIKIQSKKVIAKNELEISQDNVIIGGYHRINNYYDDYHEVSSKLMKRNLDNVNVNSSKKARAMKDSQK
ncbi:3221_t:CDS:2 [Funneliformis geosporum]|uniref:3221_t:CDS:1 n=1 Tax=Funneliformis geosporum TaxID=1117311 RepID=A0A9W4SXH7_9GLOM|nr:3221_t:CDS:2 [Funneliformis geosporum]